MLEHASAYYREVFGETKFEEDVEIQVGMIDHRLRLAQCDDNIQFKIKEPPHNPRNISIRVRCEQTHRWTIYIPVTVDVYADIVVASRSMKRGEILTTDDLRLRRTNTATVGRGYMEQMNDAVGLEMKRAINTGDVVKSGHIKKPDVVVKGQRVVVSSKSAFLTVKAEGVALSNGHIGKLIRVKNEKSKRVVEARIVAPGEVVVATR